jgi:RNA polymerase sigma-70 factor (ECF subfamily)
MATNHRTLNDENLIRLIVQARPAALSELYDRYSRMVFSLAINTVGDAATAEEITQDVFVRVWERAGQYRADQAKVSTWLTSIARHRAIDQLRRQGVRPEGQSIGWADVSPQAEPSSDGPEQAAELSIQRQHIRAALAQLPEEQKQVLAMAYFQGYSQTAIAEALGLPLGTVKTRIRLAMEKLRGMLQAEA